MFSTKKYINITAFALINCVSVLFFVKFAVIYTSYPLFLSLLFAACTTILTLSSGNIKDHFYLFRKKYFVILSFLVPFAVLIYIIIAPRLGEIGRYPAIVDWIQRFQAGSYPYNSPHTPSAYPALFTIAYPFYIIGNIGILEFIGIVLFFWFVWLLEDTGRGKTIKILILLTNIIFYYEIVTRSELFFNMMLASGVVLFSEKYLKTEKINFQFLLAALITGLVLATRSVTALIFMIYFIFRFRSELKNLVLFGTISLFVFSAFILPMYLWDPESFIKNGPFAVQSYLSNLPTLLILLFFIISVYSGWIVSDVQEFFFSGGLILFFAAAVSFLIRVLELGFSETLYKDGYDIAYFIFCVPLLLLSVKDYSIDRYLGKIYSSK